MAVMEKMLDANLKTDPLARSRYALNEVHLVDALVALPGLPDRCFDIAIIDPPYNLGKGNSWSWDAKTKMPGFGGPWQKSMFSWDNVPFADYVQFTFEWVSQIKRLVRPQGSIWIHGTYHNIGIINFVLQALDVEIINEVIWFKRNSFPNLSQRRLTASHETLLWAHTGSPRNRQYHFNYDQTKEAVYIGDNIKRAGKQMRTVWDIPNNKKPDEIKFGKHPTQKPLRITRRLLDIASKPGDTVLVPFAGSGTECIAAMERDLQFLAFENDDNYIAIAQERLRNSANQLDFPNHELYGN